MRFIRTTWHGILDYLLGLAMLGAPTLIDPLEVTDPVSIIPRLIGGLIIVQALFTDFEVGVIRLIPVRVHLMVDILAGLVLAASPFLFGFAQSLPLMAWLPHLIGGLILIGLGVFTETEPGLSYEDGNL